MTLSANSRAMGSSSNRRRNDEPSSKLKMTPRRRFLGRSRLRVTSAWYPQMRETGSFDRGSRRARLATGCRTWWNVNAARFAFVNRGWVLLSFCAVSGCLVALAPSVRSAPHQDLSGSIGDEQCLSCHRTERQALALMREPCDADSARPTEAPSHVHGPNHVHQHGPEHLEPAFGDSTSGGRAACGGPEHHTAPLVADWMIEHQRGCLGCHALRPKGS